MHWYYCLKKIKLCVCERERKRGGLIIIFFLLKLISHVCRCKKELIIKYILVTIQVPDLVYNFVHHKKGKHFFINKEI